MSQVKSLANEATQGGAERKVYTARELLRLPLEQRHAVLEKMAKAAARDYRNDAELTLVTKTLEGQDFVEA